MLIVAHPRVRRKRKQLGVNLWLLRREMGRRLLFEPAALPPPQEAAAS